MEKQSYIKLSELVDGEFTVEKVFFPKYKTWDNEAKKMLVSERWEKGYRKLYGVQTDKGVIDMSSSQLGNMLESVSQGGTATVINRTFAVKSNGKTGMDIRYYINARPQERGESPEWDKAKERFDKKDEALEDITDEINLSDIPFN